MGLLGGVINTAGNAVLVSSEGLNTFGAATGTTGMTGSLTPTTSTLGTAVANFGTVMAANSMSGIPMIGGTASKAANSLDSALGSVGNTSVAGAQIMGTPTAATAPLGVAVLSPTAINGNVANLNALSGGQILNVAAVGPTSPNAVSTGGTSNALLGMTVGGTSPVGTATAALISANVLTATPTPGAAGTVSVLSGGQLINTNLNGAGVNSALSGVGAAAPALAVVTTPMTTSIGSASSGNLANPINGAMTPVAGALSSSLTNVASTTPVTSTMSGSPVATTIAGVVAIATTGSSSLTNTANAVLTPVSNPAAGVGGTSKGLVTGVTGRLSR